MPVTNVTIFAMAAATGTTEVTSVGAVEVDYAYNRWVLAQCRGRSAQRQCRTSADLGDLLIEIGVPMREARELGARIWSRRPADAEMRAARPWEAMWRGTGLKPGTAILIAFLGPVIVAIFVVALFWLLY
jgi:hypothetical protein